MTLPGIPPDPYTSSCLQHLQQLNAMQSMAGLYHDQANATYTYSAEYAKYQQEKERTSLRNRLADKDTRMNRRLSRQRKAIWQRRALEALAVFLGCTAIPLALAVIAYCWHVAVGAVLG